MSQNVHSECHPPTASTQSNFRMVSSSPTTACGSSVLNLASILNPMPSFDSESDSSTSIARNEDPSARRTPPQHKALALDHFPLYTHSSSLRTPPKPTPSTHITNTRPATTLIWQPVETPRDHGGVERTSYQDALQSSLPPPPPPTPYTNKMQNNNSSSYTNGSSDTSSPSSSSGGGSSGGFYYYHHHHYPTPESPGFQHNEMERKRSFHDDTAKTTEPAFKQRCRDEMSHEKRHKNKILASKKGQLPTSQDGGTGIIVLDQHQHHSSSPQSYDDSLQQHQHPPPPQPRPPHSSQPLEIQFAINNDSMVAAGSSTPSKPSTPTQSVSSSAEIKKVPKKRGRPPKPESEKKKKSTNTTGKNKKAQAAAKQQIKLYCTCQTPFQSPLFMLPCDHCNQWFHGSCVNVTPQTATYLDLYICDNCTKDTGKKTSHRPVCARSSCNNPSNITTKGTQQSKYCSLECGMQMARERLSRSLLKDVGNEDADLAPLLEQQRIYVGRELDEDQNQKDMERIRKLRCDNAKLKGEAKAINRKLELFDHVMVAIQEQEKATGVITCGYDSRLGWQDQVIRLVKGIRRQGNHVILDFDEKKSEPEYSICERTGKCPQHEKWKVDKKAELDWERRMYLDKIALYNRTLHHYRQRIKQRLQPTLDWSFLENGTIRHGDQEN